MKGKSKKFLLLTNRDLEIFKTLWKWKVGTTASLGFEFFGNADSDAAYQRLTRLKQYGYLQLHPLNNSNGFVWALSLKGYEKIKHSLPPLKEDGFLSETLNHDYWCMAFQRGPMGMLYPESELISEQELRRLHQNSLPEWIPVSQVHRPDGYFRIPLNGKFVTVAMEVELNRKKDHEYHLVAHFYHSLPNVFRIVWLVQNLSDAKLIQNKFKNVLPNQFEQHLFVALNDFKLKLWNASILLGKEQSKPIGILLERGVSLVPLYREAPVVLDQRKRPYITKLYLTSQNIPFRDRVAISATPYNPLTQRTNHETNNPTYVTNPSSISLLNQ